jgi:hypothetical protein
LNPKTATQEGNVTIDFGEGVRVNLRVETHALSRNGPPIRHANVETIIKSLRSKSIENVHITD